MRTPLTPLADQAFTIEEAAIVAAQQATEAVAELLRFHREGAFSERSAFAEEVVGKLAEALNLAMEIEGDPEQSGYLDWEEVEWFRKLKQAVTAFISGWAG